MVASLPLFVNVAVPQLAMKIAAAQRKTFRDTSVEFIWSSFKSPILRLVAPTCQGLKSAINQPNLIRRLTKEAIAFAQFATTKTLANAGKESASRFSGMSSRSRGDASEKFAPNYSEAANAAQR
jgi:hypothetical protein